MTVCSIFGEHSEILSSKGSVIKIINSLCSPCKLSVYKMYSYCFRQFLPETSFASFLTPTYVALSTLTAPGEVFYAAWRETHIVFWRCFIVLRYGNKTRARFGLNAKAMNHTQAPATNISISPADLSDFEAIWPIFQAVVQAGDTYPYPPDITKETACALWISPALKTYKAVLNHQVVGTYYIKANQLGLGSHVANAGFMVHPECRGHGVGRQMGIHALEEAKRLGYRAMQFNLVVATNIASIRLWESLGFTTIGTLPQVFYHTALQEYVDALVMFRAL